MSIVLTIIGLIVAGTISMGSSMVGSAQQVNTNSKLDAIEKALMAYRIANNRLPCPTDPTLTDVSTNSAYYSANYGYETGTPGYCNIATDPSYVANPNISTYTIPTHSNGGTPGFAANTPPTTNFAALGMSTAEGAVPVKTLGLPDEFQYDGWGRKFAYAVATAMTTPASGTGMTGTAAAFMSYGSQANCGAITVQNAGAANRTQVADYVLLSYGPDGHGGYLKNGARYSSGSDNAAEQLNCHCDAAATNSGYAPGYTATYVQQEPTQTTPTDPLSIFDDIVRYKERWQMMNDYDKYHPGTKLPCTNGFQAQPATANGAGASVAIGDVNGDGIPDLIISTSASTGSGIPIYVVFGTRQGFPDPLPLDSLTGSNGFKMIYTGWESFGGNMTMPVTTGDVNGDGIADIIIGIPDDYVGGCCVLGSVNVVFGQSTWAASYNLNVGGSLIDGVHGVQFKGGTTTDNYPELGSIVAAADINGDGYADIIFKEGWDAFTSAYVIFGKSGNWLGVAPSGSVAVNNGTGTLIDGVQGIGFLDTENEGGLWHDDVGSFATGDFNGDGIADLAIGSYEIWAGYDGGSEFVVFGKSTSNSTFLPSTTIITTAGLATAAVDSCVGLQVGQTLSASTLPAGTTIATGCVAPVAYQAGLFNGSSDISASGAALPNGSSSSWSISAWVNSSAAQSDAKIVEFGSPVAKEAGAIWSSGGFYGASIWGGLPVLASTTSSGDGNWHHLVLTSQHIITNSEKLYVDGTLVASGNLSGVNITAPILRIGASVVASPTEYFNGAVEEVQIYNIALSSTQVGLLYNAGSGYYGVPSGISAANLAAGYHLNGDATDFSGNGNNGTWSGTTAYTAGIGIIGAGIATGDITLSSGTGVTAGHVPVTVAVMPLNVGSGTQFDGTKGVHFSLGSYEEVTDGHGGGVVNYEGISFGRSTAMGDFNGDGIADLIVGANNVWGNPSLFVIYGKRENWIGTGTVLLNPTNANFPSPAEWNGVSGILDGIQSIGFGGSVIGSPLAVGDVNNDGYADIITGDGNGNAYVIFGDPTSVWTPLWNSYTTLPAGCPQCLIPIALSPAGIIDGIKGTRFDGSSGPFAIGDLNGDGIPDIVIGSSSTSTVYIYNGRASGWPVVPISGNGYPLSGL